MTHRIVYGKTIEVSEDLGLSDGQAVDLIVLASDLSGPSWKTNHAVAPKKLPGPPPGWKPSATSLTAGVLAEEWSAEDDDILEQIQADRQAAAWRELPP